jgi:hypothetical protein
VDAKNAVDAEKVVDAKKTVDAKKAGRRNEFFSNNARHGRLASAHQFLEEKI